MTTTSHHTPAPSSEHLAKPGLEDRILRLLRATSLPGLRIALGVVFVWFGALKVSGDTPVGDLVAGVVPWLPAELFVTGLGAFEVVLGIVIIAGYRLTWAIGVMVAHLAGTFLVFVTQPEVAYTSNPLMVTMEGEFVAKNLVLITAGLVVAAFSPRRRENAAS